MAKHTKELTAAWTRGYSEGHTEGFLKSYTKGIRVGTERPEQVGTTEDDNSSDRDRTLLIENIFRESCSNREGNRRAPSRGSTGDTHIQRQQYKHALREQNDSPGK